MIVLINCNCCEENQGLQICSLPVTDCENTLFIVFNNFSVTDTVSLALEICATISPNMDAIFQLWILTHTSAYYLMQISNYLNSIGRFICLNEYSNSTKPY